MKSKKKNKKKVKTQKIRYIGLCCATILLIAAGIILFINRPKKPAIGFYKVSEKIQKAVLDALNAQSYKDFDVIQFDLEKPLYEQKKLVKKASLIIFNKDIETTDFFEQNAKPLEMTYTEGFPSTLQASFTVHKKNEASYVNILPILFDFYEIDINREFFNQSGMKSIDIWDDLAETCFHEKSLSQYPLILPAGEDNLFLTYLGIIAEALCGYEEYEKMIDDFSSIKYTSGKSREEKLNELLQKYAKEGGILETAIKEVGSFIRSGIIPEASLKFNSQDVLFFINNSLCSNCFISLSQHRKITNEAVKNLTSIYCPSKEFTPERKFAAEQLSLSLLRKDKVSKQIAKDLADSLQSALSGSTGLAPVQKNCEVPDHQADDVRFWLAASKGPVMPFAKVFKSDEERKIAADYLRSKLNN